MMTYSDAYTRLVYGDVFDPNLLNGARHALLTSLDTAKARWAIGAALDRYGPENVYMDGELFANDY